MSNLRNRRKRSARASGGLEAARRLLIVCEGQETEVQYFEGLREHCKNSLVTIDFEGGAGVPVTLVERAKRLRDEADAEAKRLKDDFLRYDEVWCVFDVDAHPNIPKARDTAKANGLWLAMSNPCVELWLLLHLREQPGPQHRWDLQQMLRQHMPKVPAKHVDMPLVLAGLESAIARARQLEQQALDAEDPLRNPTTEVHRLANSIDEEGRQRRTERLRDRDRGSREKAAAAAHAAMEQVALELADAAPDERLPDE